MATEKKEAAWTAARAAALARTPSDRHSHPTLPGFFIRVSPKLHAVYAYKFKDVDGAQQTGTIGAVAEAGAADGVTLEDAVTRFEKLFKAHRTKTDGSVTLQAGFEAWMQREKKGGGARSPRTDVNYFEVYQRRLKKLGGELRLGKTTGETWHKILTRAKEGTPEEKIGNKVIKAAIPGSASEARVAYWIVSAVYRRYVELGTIARNPVANETMRTAFSGKDSKKQRTEYIATMELAKFWQGLDQVPRRGHGKRAVRCLLLSGWRLNGVVQMRWDQLNLKAGIYTVKEGDEGWKGWFGEMAVNSYMLDELLARKNEGGAAESEYIFPGSYGSKTPYLQNPYGTLKSASKGLGWLVKPHDLRRTFCTVADVVLASNQRLIGLLVAHSQPNQQDDTRGANITGKYMQRVLPAERVSSHQVAEAILQISGALPLDDDLCKLFAARGQRLDAMSLADLTGDAEEGEAEEEPKQH